MMQETNMLDTTKLAELQDDTRLPDMIREGILPKFISQERFEQIRERDVVTMEITDLRLVFYLPLDSLSDDTRSASLLVTKQLLSRIGMTRRTIYRLALSHLAQEAEIRPFRDVISSLLPVSASALSSDPDEPDIYFVSNRQHSNGAAAILCPKTREDLEIRLGSPFLLLPSSVHEVLCLPADRGYEKRGWSDMVRAINQDCVEPGERLSDHAYLCMEGALLPV